MNVADFTVPRSRTHPLTSSSRSPARPRVKGYAGTGERRWSTHIPAPRWKSSREDFDFVIDELDGAPQEPLVLMILRGGLDR